MPWSTTTVLAGGAWYEGFEGATPSWRAAGGDGRYRIVQQQRVRQGAHTGDGCEYLQIEGSSGTAVYMAHDVGRPRIIDDLLPTVWVKSDRPGIQLAIRVVLPRSTDSRTGQPITTLLLGSSYSDVGRWQQLRIEEIPKALARQVRVLRMQFGPTVDGREAYVENVVLNVYGGPGVTNVWIDDLDVAGFVGASVAAGGATPPATPQTTPPVTLPALPADRRPPAAAGRADRRRVQLSGSILLVDGHPVFPRAIQYRGEPLAALKRMGFNAVWFDRLPTADLLDEANAAGIWVICPPPRPRRIDLPDEPAPVLAPLGPEYDCVLCWDLGQSLTETEVDAVRQWGDQVRTADRAGGRPLICQAVRDLRSYSRVCDLLLLDRRPLGSSLELSDYATWIQQQPRLARPGTPVWTTVQTQPDPAIRGQIRALDPSRPPPSSVTNEQLRLMVYNAVAAGSRGLLMLSDAPLTGQDPDSRDRAAAVELLNLEMELLEPWAAAGTLVANVEATQPEVVGAVLRTERARLLMPMWSAPGAQFVPAQSAVNGLSLTVPGVPEAISAYDLTPGGIEPLRHARVTGGTRVTLDEFGLTDLVLMAQDPLIVSALTQRAAIIGRRAAELNRYLAARKLETLQQVSTQIAGRAFTPPQTGEWLAVARRDLQRCDGWLTGKSYPAAYTEAARSMRAVRLVERAYWERAVLGLPSPVASPGATSFAGLPWHVRLTDRIGSARLAPNLLAGGDFESLEALVRSGWHNYQQPAAGIRAAVELSSAVVHGGTTALHLSVRTESGDAAPAAIESPPIWISSGPINVSAGQLLCIHGWVNVPAKIGASVDGLLIADSLGGEPLAARFNKTPGWKRFLLYRVATQSGPVSVSFGLTGLGDAYLDDVAIQVLQSNDIGGTPLQ